MIDFDQVYNLVELSSHETAFNREECEALYNLLLKLPDEANIVEIGVQYGRSTTVIASVKKFKPHWSFVAIDFWVEPDSQEAKDHVKNSMVLYGWDFSLVSADSTTYAPKYRKHIDLLHIDGDHSFEAVFADAVTWIPKVRKGGYVLFDDYGHPGFEPLKAAVEQYIDSKLDLKHIGTYGGKLAVFEKI